MRKVINLPYGTKSKTKTFILTLPLVTDMHEEAVLHNNFKRYSQAYNWLLRKQTGCGIRFAKPKPTNSCFSI